MKSQLRQLPSISRLLEDEALAPLLIKYPHQAVVEAAREVVDEAREIIMAGRECPSTPQLIHKIRRLCEHQFSPSFKPLINATGVILHTNLGRAPLSPEAQDAVTTLARGYSNLEFDLASGRRGSRHSHLEALLCRLTGAQAAMMVNNNAAAVLLALSALAKGKGVAVSRGQLVEIGGTFRIPDVMRQSGCKLVEVGTTNKTYIRDYEEAILAGLEEGRRAPRVGALMRVHTSNFRLSGFVHFADIAELVQLGRKYDLPVIDDLGSGVLLDTAQFGLAHEPTVQESVEAGVDVVTFSGDKLLGGPQGGLIVGKKAALDKLKKHPLARAVRIDKMTLAAMQATLLHYAREEAVEKIPIWRMIAVSADEVCSRSSRLAENLRRRGIEVDITDGFSTVGGGSLPGELLPTALLSFKGGKGAALSETALAERLRKGSPPVIGRIEKDKFLLDLRTVLPEEDDQLIEALRKAFKA